MEANSWKDRLADLKERQRRKLHVADQVERGVVCWLEILAYLRERNLPHRVLQLAAVSADEVELWEQQLNSGALASFGLTSDLLVIGEELPARKAVERRYPSVHGLRYVPDLPAVPVPQHVDVHQGIKSAIAALELPLHQEVLFFHQRYWPVLGLPLQVLADHSEPLFELWHGDALVFPEGMGWLIAQTIEGDWYAGYGGHEQQPK